MKDLLYQELIAVIVDINDFHSEADSQRTLPISTVISDTIGFPHADFAP